MPDTNKSNKLKESSMPGANESMPNANEEDEFIVDNEELDEELEEEPPPSRVPEKLPAGANKAKKTQDGYKNGMNYINRFLTAKKLPAFDNLTPEDMEADHLQNWIENIMCQGTNLMVTAKVKLFSKINVNWKGFIPLVHFRRRRSKLPRITRLSSSGHCLMKETDTILGAIPACLETRKVAKANTPIQ
jgi:hypothetical protein